jgi:uncharacterized membrane protein
MREFLKILWIPILIIIMILMVIGFLHSDFYQYKVWTNDGKAKYEVVTYLKLTLEDVKSYKPVSFGKLDTLYNSEHKISGYEISHFYYYRETPHDIIFQLDSTTRSVIDYRVATPK